jgi:phosphoribosylformimino-5-aminoimidazole carboxamide ribotide isomerase
MEVIPAIDLLEGRCVRLFQGDYAQSEVFGDDPVAVARQWAAQGATRLHLVDLDGAKTGQPVNYEAIGQIVAALDIPVQVGGGVRSLAIAEQLLALGVDRAIVGTLAVDDPELLALLCDRHSGRIAVGIDARNGKVATRGWVDTTEIEAQDLVRQVCQLDVAAIIYTDIHRDGTLNGPNLEQLKTIAMLATVPVIASGGIGSVTDLLSLLAIASADGSQLTGAIVGKALYTRAIALPEAIRAVGNGRWQDVPPQGLDGTAFA